MFRLIGEHEYVIQQYAKYHPNAADVLPIVTDILKWTTPHGRHAMIMDLWRNDAAIVASKKMKAQLKGPLPRALVLTGLFRTGSTKLHRLLYTDPVCGGLDGLHAMMGPRPPVTHAVFDKLVEAEGVQTSHPIEAVQAEEEFFCLDRASLTPPLLVFGMDSFQAAKEQYAMAYPWLKEEVAAHAVRLGHNDLPLTHLLMKTPFHAVNLDAARAALGEDMFLVGTTRPLDKVVPSTCKLFDDWARRYFDVDALGGKIFIGERVVEMLKSMSDTLGAGKDCFDVVLEYRELMSDPIGAVEKVYAALGKTVSPAHRQAMRDWIKANPQGKLGRARYSLEEYGLKATDTGGVRCLSTGCTVEPVTLPTAPGRGRG